MNDFIGASPREAIFLADAHLNGRQDPNQEALLEFLNHIEPIPGSVVILGDLFEFFSGRNRAAEAAYRPVLKRLASLAPFHFLEGNHDYDLSSEIPELAQWWIHPGPINARVQGLTVRLTHGDRADPFDLGTRCLRRCLQSTPMRWLRDSVLPQDWLFRFGLAFAHQSRKRIWPGRAHEARWVRRTALRDLRRHQVDAVVYAHTHLPLLERLPSGGVLANPGQAVVGGSYLKLSERTFSLHRFPSGELLAPGRITLPR